ncbi:hypothetical protein [Pseudobdellovibrio exovorus]|jgi:hypothetical protein|uniref:Uncharacterized protein n=1 Tax=Pseudobdellovibrio exovorus JSS TaxID=1184267 RepID=M4V8U2_9BACT|nr:hypothetical protein [Pseudobdellovibrio exovorus]AGH94436.1 hypothetical protein A11Q_216 [Pseudobdellovibrio exovorus JSS]
MKKVQEQKKLEVQTEFVFMKPLKVSKTKNGNLLVYVNHTTGISLHPNFVKAVMDSRKKAS